MHFERSILSLFLQDLFWHALTALQNQLITSILITELYNGCVKIVPVTRKRFDPNGNLQDQEKEFSFAVKPGWKKGTKVTFVNAGDEGHNIIPADLVFVIEEIVGIDSCYSRDGNNLIYTHKLSLSDALTDCSLQIPTLDQRIISLACPEVVSPFYEKVILGELICEFLLLFDSYLIPLI